MRWAIATVIVALIIVTGCGGPYTSVGPTAVPIVASGRRQTENRPVQGFSSVAISAAGVAFIERTGAESLQITADDNVLPHVSVTVVQGRLFLGLEAGVQITGGSGVVYRVTARDLVDVVASGASRVEAAGIESRYWTAGLSGASTLRASGSTDELFLTLSGASRCDCADVRARRAWVNASGASYAVVRATEELFVNVSGASTVEYYGNPTVRSDVTFGSLVRRVGE